MPILLLISFVVVAVIWLAMLVTVISQGLGVGLDLWIQLFVLIAFPLAATWAYLWMHAARGDLD